MTLTQLLDKLQAVRRSGTGWMARCPAHEDRNPSLSIDEREGRILLYCHAGCTVDAICAARGIRVSDLFSGPRPSQPNPRIVRDAERQIAHLRSRLTPRERVFPVTVVYISPDHLNEGIARTLALAVEGEIVQAVLEGER